MGYSVLMPGISNIVRMALIVEGGILCLAITLGWFLGYPPYDQVQFRWLDFILAVLATSPSLLALHLSIRSRWKSLTRLFREIEKQILPLFDSLSILEFAAISILAGIAEESLFRGVLQTALADWLGGLIGLIVASLLFGLAHFITPTYALFAFLFGLYLGWMQIVSENLLAPILVHVLYDFMALIYLVRRYRRIQTMV